MQPTTPPYSGPPMQSAPQAPQPAANPNLSLLLSSGKRYSLYREKKLLTRDIPELRRRRSAPPRKMLRIFRPSLKGRVN